MTRKSFPGASPDLRKTPDQASNERLPAKKDERSDGISSPEIKIFKAGENAKSDTRSTAAATRTT